MKDLAFIKDIQHEPLALLVVAVVVVLRIIDLVIKHAPQWLSKEKTLPLYKWQIFVTEKLGTIESTLATHEYLLDKTSEGTLENQLFNDNLAPFIRLKAFRRLLAMKRNGRVWAKGCELILQNKEMWLDVLDTELGILVVDIAYYEARLKEIRRKFYNDFSEK